MESNSFCFIHEEFMKPRSWNTKRFLELMFDGNPPTGFTAIPFSTESFAHIMHQAGAFDSIGNARRNGWNKPVPPGFTMMTVTKRRIAIAVLNVFEGMDDDLED